MNVSEYFKFSGVVYIIFVVWGVIGNNLVVICVVVYLVWFEGFNYVVFLCYMANLDIRFDGYCVLLFFWNEGWIIFVFYFWGEVFSCYGYWFLGMFW